MKICSVDSCQKKQAARGLCAAHYQKLRKYGDPLAGRTYVTDGDAIAKFQSASTVSNGECEEWPLEMSRRGYGILRVGRSTKRPAHRVAYELANGPIPDGMFIDHSCGNRACVNASHLRLATVKQNAENLAVGRAASGYRGVTKHRSKWRACVGHNGKQTHVGTFDTAEEANEAAIRARNELFTHNIRDRG